MDPSVAEIVTFNGCEELLRGSRLETVLRFGAIIFRDSRGSAATYSLSRRVVRIGTFISHNWSVGRFKKFVALSFHFNFDLSLVLMVFVVLVLGVASASGAFPVVQEVSRKYPSGVVCRLVCVPLFFCVLFLIRDVLGCLGVGCHSVFLDKTCIHQEDLDIQLRGIRKLGAFLFNSGEMLVLYTDVYLLKLWTVYEVACFSSLHPVSRLRIVPISQARIFCVALAYIYLASVLSLITRTFVASPDIFYVICGGAACAYGCVQRTWYQELAVIRNRLSCFSVRDCTCFCIEDRPVVYRNIVELMKACMVVDASSSTEEALTAFDEMIKADFGGHFINSFSRFAFQYKHYVVLGAALSIPTLLDIIAALAYGCPVRQTLADASSHVFGIFCALPFGWLAIEFCAASHLNWRGPLGWTWTILSSVFIAALPVGVANLFFGILAKQAVDSDIQLVGTILFSGCLGVVVFLIASGRCLWGKQLCCMRSRTSQGDMSSEVDTDVYGLGASDRI